MKKQKVLFALSVFWLSLSGLPAFSQSSLLDNYIEDGLKNNLALQQQRFDVQKSLLALDEAKGLYYPQISFIANYTIAGGGRNISFPVGDLLNPVYQSLNQLTNSDQFPQIENVNEQFLPNNFHETKLRFIQPLFNSDIYYNYKAKQELIHLQEAQKMVYEQELKKEIRIAYFQYLKTLELLDIYTQTESLLQEVLRVNQKLVKNDKATPEIVYGAEYEIQKILQDRAEAKKSYQSSQAYFNFLLNRDLDQAIQVDSNLIEEALIPNYQLDQMQNEALSQRKELEQLNRARKLNEHTTRLQEAKKYPSLNMVGDLGFQGFGYNFGPDQDFWLLQFSLQWDLFKGKQVRQKIAQSRIEQTKLNSQYQALENQIQLQVRQAFYALEAGRKAVVAAQSGKRSAQRNFFLTKRKYEEGLARYVELVDTRSKYTNAQLLLKIAQYDFLIRQAELERFSGQ